MIYLSVEQVLFLHDRLIEETGGEHGVRDLGGLESALARPRASFGDSEFYPDIFAKAAVLMDGLTRNHAFIDGKHHWVCESCKKKLKVETEHVDD